MLRRGMVDEYSLPFCFDESASTTLTLHTIWSYNYLPYCRLFLTPLLLNFRRSKNRVNARRSRERKKLMLDTLQQEHWRLHQKKQKIQGENTKLKQAIGTLQSLLNSNDDRIRNQNSHSIIPGEASSNPISSSAAAAAAGTAAASTPSTRTTIDQSNHPGTGAPTTPLQPTAAASAPPLPSSGIDWLTQQLLSGNQSQQPQQSNNLAHVSSVVQQQRQPQQQVDALLTSMLLSQLTGGTPQARPPPIPPTAAPPPALPTTGNDGALTVILGALIASMMGGSTNATASNSPAPPPLPTPPATNNNILSLMSSLIRPQLQQAPPPPPPPETNPLAVLLAALSSQNIYTNPPAHNNNNNNNNNNNVQQLQSLLSSLGQQQPPQQQVCNSSMQGQPSQLLPVNTNLGSSGMSLSNISTSDNPDSNSNGQQQLQSLLDNSRDQQQPQQQGTEDTTNEPPSRKRKSPTQLPPTPASTPIDSSNGTANQSKNTGSSQLQQPSSKFTNGNIIDNFQNGISVSSNYTPAQQSPNPQTNCTEQQIQALLGTLGQQQQQQQSPALIGGQVNSQGQGFNNAQRQLQALLGGTGYTPNAMGMVGVNPPIPGGVVAAVNNTPNNTINNFSSQGVQKPPSSTLSGGGIGASMNTTSNNSAGSGIGASMNSTSNNSTGSSSAIAAASKFLQTNNDALQLQHSNMQQQQIQALLNNQLTPNAPTRGNHPLLMMSNLNNGATNSPQLQALMNSLGQTQTQPPQQAIPANNAGNTAAVAGAGTAAATNFNGNTYSEHLNNTNQHEQQNLNGFNNLMMVGRNLQQQGLSQQQPSDILPGNMLNSITLPGAAGGGGQSDLLQAVQAPGSQQPQQPLQLPLPPFVLQQLLQQQQQQSQLSSSMNNPSASVGDGQDQGPPNNNKDMKIEEV